MFRGRKFEDKATSGLEEKVAGTVLIQQTESQESQGQGGQTVRHKKVKGYIVL